MKSIYILGNQFCIAKTTNLNNMTKLKRIDMNGRRQFGRIEYKDEVIRTLSKSLTTFTVGKVFRIDKKFTQAIVIFLQINKYIKNVYKSEKKNCRAEKNKICGN